MSVVSLFFLAAIFIFGSLLERSYATQTAGIKQDIRVGVYDNPPKIFINEYGEPDGFFVDLVRDIAKRENLNVIYVKGSWEYLMHLLYNGEIDVLPDVAYSIEREQLFKLSSIPALDSWLEVFTSRISRIQSVQDLNNSTIGVLRGSIQEQYASNNLKESFNIDFDLALFDDYTASVKALKNGHVDVILADRFFYFSPFFDNEILPTGIVLRPTELYFAFPKEADAQLVSRFDRNLADMRNNAYSEYFTSLRHWLDRSVEPRTPVWVYWVLILVSGSLLITAVFSLVLKKKVKAKTKELELKNTELFSEKERAEQNAQVLRESHKIAQVGYWWLDHTGNNNLYWSDELFELLDLKSTGYKPGFNSLMDFVFPDDHNVVKNQFIEHLNNASEFDCSHRILTHQNKLKFIRTRCETTFDEDGKPLQTLGIVADITKLKLAEQEQIRLSEILGITSDFVSTATPDSRLTYLNKAGFKMLGWDENESVEGKMIIDLHPEWAWEIIKSEGLPETLSKGSWKGEVALLHRNGQEIPVSQVIMAHYDADGNHDYFSTIMRNITEHKQAQQALEESEERYRSIFAEAPVGLAVYQQEELVFLNPAVVKLLGAESEADLIGNTFYSVLHPDFRNEVKSAIECLKVGEIGNFPIETLLIKQDGTTINAELTASQLVYKNEPAIQLVITDISDKKKYLNAMEAQVKILKDIAWTQSHVVRAPLARMLGIITVLEDTEKNEFDSEQMMKELLNSAYELDDVIRDISQKTYHVSQLDEDIQKKFSNN